MSNGTEENTQITTITPTDRYGVPWGFQEEKVMKNGAKRFFIHFESSIFAVVETPPPGFGQNVSAFGWEVAMNMAASEGYSDHDFGACVGQVGTAFRHTDGCWYMRVVPTHPRRYRVYEEVKYEDGTTEVVPSLRKESWVMVRLDQVKPLVDHPLNKEPFRQRDDFLTKLEREQSASAAALVENERKKSKRKKKKSRKLSASEYARMMGQG